MKTIQSDSTSEIGQVIHCFERAGLGKAPFRYTGMSEKTYQACPGAPIQPGGSCDYCGNGIRFCFGIKSADGRQFVVGSDCVHKTDDAGLRRIIDAEVRKIKNTARHAKEAALIAAGKSALEIPATQSALAAMPNESRPGESRLQQIEWFFRNAGNAGKCWAAKIVLRAAGFNDSQIKSI